MHDLIPEITPLNDDLPVIPGDVAAAHYATSLGVPVTPRWVRSESEARRLASIIIGGRKAYAPADIRAWLRNANKRESVA